MFFLVSFFDRHPGESCDPAFDVAPALKLVIPAEAGIQLVRSVFA
jgi:hypothetical protein